MFAKIIKIAVIALGCMAFTYPAEYPIDGYQSTGIKRLKRLQLSISGDLPDAGLPPGAFKSINDIKLQLTTKKALRTDSLLKVDPDFQKKINALFPRLDKSYSVAILDMTKPEAIRYAQQNQNSGYQPGSVGKLAVITGLFVQLEKIYPDSWEDRTNLLKTKLVRAGQWALSDEHTVPVFDVITNKLVKRQVVASDVFSLYEWADHMLSVSNNGAASVVWREVLLMAAFCDSYPTLTESEADAFFKNTPRNELTDLGNEVVNMPLRDLGIKDTEWRLGSFFTRGANNFVGDKGGSIGTPLGLIKWLVQLEQGNIVDEASSLEIKRLMYMTDRRIRYAQAPQLRGSGGLFQIRKPLQM